MSDFLLTQVINFGTPLVGLILFLGALGLPLGASVVVIAAGAFSQQGILNWPITVAIGLICAVLGDMLSFGMGYYSKDAVQDRFGKSPSWRNVRATFQRSAGPAIFFTRWLFTAFAIPTNLIAGGSGYKFSRFMAYDIAGEMMWISLYGGLGYLFGSHWELIYDFTNNFGMLIAGLVILGIGIRLAWNWQEKNKLLSK
jgi:membrane protein DedA with SNARE-associated domain